MLRLRPRHRRSTVVRLLAGVLAVLALAAVTLTVFGLLTPLHVSAKSVSESPLPSLVAATPSPSGTTIVTPARIDKASTVPFALQIPRVGIYGVISDYTPEMLVEGAVKPPPGTQVISRYTGIPGCEISAHATASCGYYGHSAANGPAVFNTLRLVSKGDIVVISNPDVYLRYEVVDIFTVLKPDLPADSRISYADPTISWLYSCYRPDGYPENDATRENVIVKIKLIADKPPVKGAF